MDAREKLFRRISKKNREALREILVDLLGGGVVSNVKKLKVGNFYRLGKSKFRIIFHYTKSVCVEIDSIRLRSEKTYRGK